MKYSDWEARRLVETLTSRKVADSALDAAGVFIDSQLRPLLEESGKNWEVILDAAEIVQAEGRTAREHVAFQLLHSVFDQLVPAPSGVVIEATATGRSRRLRRLILPAAIDRVRSFVPDR